MSLATKAIEQAGAGLRELFSRKGAVTASGDVGWRPLFGPLGQFLPGSKRDWAAMVGDAWDNSVVRIVLKWREDTFSEPPLVVRRPGKADKLEAVPNHPLLALLDTPNQYYDGTVLFAGLWLSLALDGNGYMHIERAPSGKMLGLTYIPHFMIEPVPGGLDNWISHYAYSVKGLVQEIPVEDVVHLRDGLDPRNLRKGMSRTGAALRRIAQVNAAETYEVSILHNRGIPGVVFSPKPLAGGEVKPFTPDQQQAFVGKFQEKFTGDRVGEPLVMGIPVDVTTLGIAPDQMALDKLFSTPATVICAAFNIDPKVVGLPSDTATYANFTEANSAAYRQCVRPSLARMARQLTRRLMREVQGAQPQDQLGHDFSEIAALQEDQDALAERAGKGYIRGVLKRSEARIAFGKESTPEDDLYFTDLKVAAVPAAGGGPAGKQARPFRGEGDTRYP